MEEEIMPVAGDPVAGDKFHLIKTYPLYIIGDDGNEILRVELGGEIYLRGMLIGTDAEVAKQLNSVGEALRLIQNGVSR